MTSVNGNELRVEDVPVDLDLGAIEDLQQRLSRWQRARDLGHDWERGTPTTWIAELLNDWHKFDVEVLQGRLDALTHYRAKSKISMSTSYESLVQGHALCRCCSRMGGPGHSSNTSS